MILGISYDTQEENKAFREKEGFGFKLLSDADKAVSDAYGAKRPDDHDWAVVPKRISYLIDPDGRIARRYEVSDVNAHPEEVLSDLRSLTGG